MNLNTNLVDRSFREIWYKMPCTIPFLKKQDVDYHTKSEHRRSICLARHRANSRNQFSPEMRDFVRPLRLL